MGTSHFVCVWYKGGFVVTQYGQHDGCPKWAGVKILEFLRVPENIQKLQKGLQYIYKPSKEERDKAIVDIDELLLGPNTAARRAWGYFLHHPNNLKEITQSLSLSLSLHSWTGVGILALIASACEFRKCPVWLEPEPEFARGILSCEWAYVVDLDQQVLEVFHNYEMKTPGHRFADIDSDELPSLVSSIRFSELEHMDQQQFLTLADKEDEDELLY